VRPSVEDDVLVDLVSNRDYVLFPAEFGDLLKLHAGVDCAGRVVRIAEDDRLGSIGEGGG